MTGIEDLLARLGGVQDKKAREWLILQFSLSELSPTLQKAVKVSAIPHWFHGGYLASALGCPLTNANHIIEQLLALSFIGEFPGRGYCLHDRTRALLLDYLWEEDPTEFVAISNSAAGYCMSQSLNDAGWRIEWIYHLILAQPTTGIYQMRVTGSEWQAGHSYDHLETLVRRLQEHASAGRLVRLAKQWTRFWEAAVDFSYARFAIAQQKYAEIAADSETDLRLAIDVARQLGATELMVARHKAARRHFEKALTLSRQSGEVREVALSLLELANLDHSRAQYGRAGKGYDEARQLFHDMGDLRGEASSLHGLADVNVSVSQFKDAQRNYEDGATAYGAIEDYMQQAECLGCLGDVSRLLDEYQRYKQVCLQ